MELDTLYTKEDICEILGVTESWLNLQIQQGRIPHYRIGKKKVIRFSKDHLQEYLSSREFKKEN